MNRLDDHVLYEELAAGHALYALEPEEEQVFREHLSGCTRCQAEVEEHRSTLGLLASATGPVDPPPTIWEGIRAGLGPVPDRSSSAGPASGDRTASKRVVPLAAARERRQARQQVVPRWAGVAAAAAVVVGLGAWNVSLQSSRSAETERSARLAAAVQVLGATDARRVPLTSEDGQVVAVAVVSDEGLSLVVDGLAPNPDDTSYVLWTQSTEGELRPVEAFDATGEVDVVTDLPAGDGVAAYALSREQGSQAPPQPLGPVVASGQA